MVAGILLTLALTLGLYTFIHHRRDIRRFNRKVRERLYL